MAAGITTLQMLGIMGEPAYQRLEIAAIYLEDGLRRAAEDAEVPVYMSRAGSTLTMFFTDRAVTDFESAKRADTTRFAAYMRAMLNRGIFLAPSQFEAMFVSMVHTDAEIEATIEAAATSLADVR
jgi:glutamate-1-semialdehyde 2,1-aminomutase